MFISLTIYDECGDFTYPGCFNINHIELFHPIDAEDLDELPKWKTLIVVSDVVYRVMEDYGYVLGAINEITSSRG